MTFIASPKQSIVGTAAIYSRFGETGLHELSGNFGIDEAGVDFAEENALNFDKRSTVNVIVLRTLSKGYLSAGLRLGFG